jgi:hypothetical protein
MILGADTGYPQGASSWLPERWAGGLRNAIAPCRITGHSSSRSPQGVPSALRRDERDASGAMRPLGIYYCQLGTGGHACTRRFVLTR